MSSEEPADGRGSGDRQFESVLLYDGDCAFCSAGSRAVRQLDETGIIPWDHPSAQAILVAQFGEAPFALFLVDGEADTIWAGRAAARELCARAGMPSLVKDVVAESYDGITHAVRRISGLDRTPDPYHGSYTLSRAAQDEYPALVSAASDNRDWSTNQSEDE